MCFLASPLDAKRPLVSVDRPGPASKGAARALGGFHWLKNMFLFCPVGYCLRNLSLLDFLYFFKGLKQMEGGLGVVLGGVGAGGRGQELLGLRGVWGGFLHQADQVPQRVSMVFGPSKLLLVGLWSGGVQRGHDP